MELNIIIRPGTIVTAEIDRVSSKNHVLSIDNERFGVYHDYYKEITW